MTPKDITKIIEDNDLLVNVGGHFFEGADFHPPDQGLLQMSDLIPLEEGGVISRVDGWDETGKKYVAAFKKNPQPANQ